MQNKKKEWFRILFIGDICGRFGRRFLSKVLSHMKIKFTPDIVIANGENSAGGLGINRKTAFEIFNCGVDVITGGNHIWDKKEAIDLLREEERIVRPLNFPASAPGHGCFVYKSRSDHKKNTGYVGIHKIIFYRFNSANLAFLGNSNPNKGPLLPLDLVRDFILLGFDCSRYYEIRNSYSNNFNFSCFFFMYIQKENPLLSA